MLDFFSRLLNFLKTAYFFGGMSVPYIRSRTDISLGHIYEGYQQMTLADKDITSTVGMKKQDTGYACLEQFCLNIFRKIKTYSLSLIHILLLWQPSIAN